MALIKETSSFSPGLGIHSSIFWGITHRFSEQIAQFLPKSRAIERFAPSLIPSEGPERIAHSHSFLVSNLSNLLASQTGNERIFFFFKKPTKTVKTYKNTIVFKFFEQIACFFKQNTVQKWAICSQKTSNLLIWSFVLSDLSKSLTVAKHESNISTVIPLFELKHHVD